LFLGLGADAGTGTTTGTIVTLGFKIGITVPLIFGIEGGEYTPLSGELQQHKQPESRTPPRMSRIPSTISFLDTLITTVPVFISHILNLNAHFQREPGEPSVFLAPQQYEESPSHPGITGGLRTGSAQIKSKGERYDRSPVYKSVL
jgi:hypothetical protein